MKQHYVYEMIDPRTNVPFYVGAGSGKCHTKRLRDHISEAKSNTHTNHDKCMAILEILNDGMEPTLIIHQCVDATHATTLERTIIKQHGMLSTGGILTNRHPGGGGISGAGTARNKNGRLPPKPVYQFNLDGKLIKCHAAVTQAAAEVGVSHTAIINACRGKTNTKTVAGSRWSYSDVLSAPLELSTRARRHIYKQFDMDGNYIATYKSGVEIKRTLGIDNSTLLKYFKKEIRHAGGFLWERSILNDVESRG